MINASILLLQLWRWGAGVRKDRRVHLSLHQTVLLSGEAISRPPNPGAGGGETVRCHGKRLGRKQKYEQDFTSHLNVRNI